MGFLKKLKKSSLFWSGVTATAGAISMVYLLPIELAVISFVILACHEMAHFLSAYAVGASPQWPVFIPLGFVVVGWTKIKDIDTKLIPLVALSGPVVGMMLSTLAFVIGLVLGSQIVITGAFWALCFEIFAATLGTDGKTARKWRRISLERTTK